MTTLQESKEKTRINIINPYLDNSPELEDFLINDEIERILMHTLFWSIIIILANIYAW